MRGKDVKKLVRGANDAMINRTNLTTFLCEDVFRRLVNCDYVGSPHVAIMFPEELIDISLEGTPDSHTTFCKMLRGSGDVKTG